MRPIFKVGLGFICFCFGLVLFCAIKDRVAPSEWLIQKRLEEQAITAVASLEKPTLKLESFKEAPVKKKTVKKSAPSPKVEVQEEDDLDGISKFLYFIWCSGFAWIFWVGLALNIPRFVVIFR